MLLLFVNEINVFLKARAFLVHLRFEVLDTLHMVTYINNCLNNPMSFVGMLHDNTPEADKFPAVGTEALLILFGVFPAFTVSTY